MNMSNITPLSNNAKNPFSQFDNKYNILPDTKNKNARINLRYPTHRKPKAITRSMALGGSIIGTVGALLYLAKGQNKKLTNLKDVVDLNYGVKEIVTMGTSSIIGGVVLGSLADKKDDNVPKVKEGIFQTLNVIIPAICSAALLKMVQSSKKLKDSKLAKIGAITMGVAVGMAGACASANFINDPNNNEKDRKITPDRKSVV